VALKYLLTLSTVTDAGKPLGARTSWVLTRNDVIVARGGGVGDPHGDHARSDGRTAAKKDAASQGLRVTDSDVRVVYADRAPSVS
jgi:hypothetical protein